MASWPSWVCTADKLPRLKVDELTAAGCYRVYSDTASGSLDDRSQFDRTRQTCDRRHPRLLAPRPARPTLRHLIHVATGLTARGVGSRSLREDSDTTTPASELVLHVFASLAQFERKLMVKLTKAGLAAVCARGLVGGRPPALGRRGRQAGPPDVPRP